MSGRRLVFGLLLGGALLGAAACGGSEGDDNTHQPATGSGGSSGGNGAPCGSKTCGPVEGVTGDPCCISPLDGRCGVLQGDTCTTPPPPSESGCPSIGSGTFSATGCCTVGGQCGIDASMFMPGLGCIDLALVAGFAQGDGGLSFEVPTPRPCP
jgi:hypothetical protein